LIDPYGIGTFKYFAISCKVSLVTLQWHMIRSFRHKGLEAFFRRGTKTGIQPPHAAKLRLQLTALDAATKPEDLAAPGWRLHALTGDLRGFHSITVNGNWRVIFRFIERDVELVDYLDYH
jgi:proteic killer suppression protein